MAKKKSYSMASGAPIIEDGFFRDLDGSKDPSKKKAKKTAKKTTKKK